MTWFVVTRRSLLVVLTITAMSIAGGALWSRAYRGYWFSLPQLDARIMNANVRSVALIEKGRLARDPVRLAQLVESYRVDPDSVPYARLLDVLDHHHVLAPASNQPIAFTGSVSDLLTRLDSMRFSPPVSDPSHLSGYLAEVDGTDGQRLFFVAIAGAEVSHDHYPACEMLFREGAESDTLLSVRRWFFDVDGMHFNWGALSVVVLPVACAVFLLGFVVVGMTAAIRRSRPQAATV